MLFIYNPYYLLQDMDNLAKTIKEYIDRDDTTMAFWYSFDGLYNLMKDINDNKESSSIVDKWTESKYRSAQNTMVLMERLSDVLDKAKTPRK